jgi:hypothetical protein
MDLFDHALMLFLDGRSAVQALTVVDEYILGVQS